MAIANGAWRAQAATLTRRSAFHRERLGNQVAEIGSVLDLDRLPLMTKDDVRSAQGAHPPFGTNLAVEPAAVKRVFQTSGSSGEPSLVALTAADLDSWATIGARAYRATGIEARHSVLTTLGAGPFAAGATHDTIDRIGARRLPVAPGDTERAMWAIDAGLADTLLTTPSFARHLAGALAARGIDPAAIERVVVGGEPGGGVTEIRSRLEAAFGAVVTEVAGIGEVAASLYGECAERVGMHFCGQGLVWPELIDPDTENPVAIAPGATGELVYTTLVREAMPLVRFRSRDIAHVVGTACECGRTSFRLRIVGRSDDTFIVRGVNVHPTAVQAVVAEFTAGRARVVLPRDAGVAVEPPVLVQVEAPGEPGPELAPAIEAALRERLTFRAAVEFVADLGDARYKSSPVVRR